MDNQIVDYFSYLDTLRESAITNMYGAAPYLMNAFDLDTDEARAIHVGWMDTFDPDISIEDRATQYLDTL